MNSLESLPIGILLVDPAGLILEINGEAMSLLQGMEPTPKSGMTLAAFLKLLEAKGSNKADEILEKLHSRGEGEFLGHMEDGRWLRLLIRTDSAGNMAIVITDAGGAQHRRAVVTEVQRMARAGVWEFDLQSGRIWFTDEVWELFGPGSREAMASIEDWIAHVHPEDREAMATQVQLSMQTLQPYEMEYRVVPPDGKLRWIQAKGSILFDLAGAPSHAVGVFWDTSEDKAKEAAQRELLEQLHHSQRLDTVGRIAGAVAHDFNNLLTIVLSSAELIQMGKELDASTARYLRSIEDAALSGADLTGQLLAFSKRHVVKPSRLDLHETVGAKSRMLSRLVPERIRLTQQSGEGSGSVMLDMIQLEQVLLNLVVNARDAITGEGTITIRTHEESGDDGRMWATIEVEDTGHGMDAQTVAQTVNPFFTTKGDRGTGLGLATVTRILDAAGGDLQILSEPGSGTTARVRLPLTEAIEEAVTSQFEDSSLPISRILLVDDQPSLRNVLATILREMGHTVFEASCSTEALELWKREYALDFLISDLVMPELSGLELAIQLEELEPSLKILLISGYIDEELVEAVEQSSYELLRKPFAPVEMLAALARLALDHREAQPNPT